MSTKNTTITCCPGRKRYIYQDFVSLCKANRELVEYVFELFDWQHPANLIEGDWVESGVLPCESCDYLYDTETHDYCPRCGWNVQE